MTPREAARALACRLSAANIDDPELEAEVLVRTATGLSREQFYAGAPATLERLEALVERRLTREPLAYITGTREFYGHAFEVTPAVLIPRQETELLVEMAISATRDHPGALVVDVGTGSGCIAASIALARTDAGPTLGLDASADTLRVARRNATRLGASVALVQSNLAMTIGAADVVVANLPYIPQATIPALAPEVREWEPREALDGGADGLDLIRPLIDDCGRRLRPGLLALECDPAQAAEIGRLMQRAGGAAVEVHRDLAGSERVVSCRWDTGP